MVVLGGEAVSDERGTPVVLHGLDGRENMACDPFEYEVSVCQACLRQRRAILQNQLQFWWPPLVAVETNLRTSRQTVARLSCKLHSLSLSLLPSERTSRGLSAFEKVTRLADALVIGAIGALRQANRFKTSCTCISPERTRLPRNGRHARENNIHGASRSQEPSSLDTCRPALVSYEKACCRTAG